MFEHEAHLHCIMPSEDIGLFLWGTKEMEKILMKETNTE
jgi:hypothetical protein